MMIATDMNRILHMIMARDIQWNHFQNHFFCWWMIKKHLTANQFFCHNLNQTLISMCCKEVQFLCVHDMTLYFGVLNDKLPVKWFLGSSGDEVNVFMTSYNGDSRHKRTKLNCTINAYRPVSGTVFTDTSPHHSLTLDLFTQNWPNSLCIMHIFFHILYIIGLRIFMPHIFYH